MLKRLYGYTRLLGVGGLTFAIYRRFFNHKVKSFASFANEIVGAKGLEIGGPSKVFSSKGFFPIYPLVGNLDNCTYQDHTIWEGKISEGKTFRYDSKHAPGRQYILEASNLHVIPVNSYDCLFSSHVLEHLANPLKGLEEWTRVVKPEGTLVIIVPHKDGTFDHLRPVSSFEHILNDYLQDTHESDLTHLEETLKLHDLGLDNGFGDFARFKEQLDLNHKTRCMHQHVFNTPLLAKLLDHAGLKILALEPVRPCHILAVSRKVNDGSKPDNDRFLDRTSEIYRISPFRSDMEGLPES